MGIFNKATKTNKVNKNIKETKDKAGDITMSLANGEIITTSKEGHKSKYVTTERLMQLLEKGNFAISIKSGLITLDLEYELSLEDVCENDSSYILEVILNNSSAYLTLDKKSLWFVEETADIDCYTNYWGNGCYCSIYI